MLSSKLQSGVVEQLVDKLKMDSLDVNILQSSIAKYQTLLESEFAQVTCVLQQLSSIAMNQTSQEAKFALCNCVFEQQQAIKANFDSVLAKLPMSIPPDTDTATLLSLLMPPQTSPDQSDTVASPMSLSTKPPEESLPECCIGMPPQPQLSMERKSNIMRSIAVECTQVDELERLLATKSRINCYDGLEPSGRMHVAQGFKRVLNAHKLISAGCEVTILIAYWFAMNNNKMGGDLKKIKVVGQYFLEIFKALNMNVEGKVKFLWASEEINSRPNEYWLLVMDIARRTTISRIKRCCQIMGRSEEEELSVAQILYACMQCADVFFYKADICQMGMDQRKVNMLAREYCEATGRKNKPVILSHGMLPGLKEGQLKMSKSDPSSSIFMDDEEVEVNAKINKAFCPARVVENNPCLEYINHLIFPGLHKFVVERKPENGGDKTFTSFEDLVIDYESGELHPADLKPALAKALNCMLQPVRDHFKENAKAKELLKRVKSYRVTRQLPVK